MRAGSSVIHLLPHEEAANVIMTVLSRTKGRTYKLQYIGQSCDACAPSSHTLFVTPDEFSCMKHPTYVDVATDVLRENQTVEETVHYATGSKFFLIRSFPSHQDAASFLRTHVPDHFIYKITR